MVSIYGELLQKRFGGRLGAKGDEYISCMVQGASRMEQLLKDLQVYTRASVTGEEAVEDIDSGEILDSTLLTLGAAIKESGASITRTELPRLRVAKVQLEQVFQNLIANAIRYRSCAPPRIHVAAVQQGAEWLFSVQDNGIGIDPQYKEQIFGIFKRLHSNSEYPGTGMGLAICDRIIQRTDGRI